MKNSKKFIFVCLLASSLGFGMQKQQQQTQKTESKPSVVYTRFNLNSQTPHSTPLVLNANFNTDGSQRPGSFPTEGLIRLQGNHPPAIPLATRQQQIFTMVKGNFLSWTESKIKTFQVLTKANLEKIKNLSPCQVIEQKNLYQKDLAKSVETYNALLGQIKPETKAMLHVELKTNAEHAAQAMEKQVLTNDARINCYYEAQAIQELQLVIEVRQQAIKDCDQRVENLKSEIIQEIKSTVEKISTEALINVEIPALEKELRRTSLMIQRYEKDPAALAEYQDKHFRLMTQRDYLEKVVRFRQAQEKFEQLKELQILFSGFTDQLSAKEQQLLKAGEKALVEEGEPKYQIDARLTQEAKDWLTKCNIPFDQFENLVYFDALQTHIGNEIITSVNAIAKQESIAVFNAESGEFIGITRDAFALASEANFTGNPVEAVALLKIANTFEQVTKDAINTKTAQAEVNVKTSNELRVDVTSLKQAFDMLAWKADKLSDDAKLALKSAYESFDNLPPQEKVQQLMEVTAVALLAGQTAVGGVILRAVIKHAVRILPVMYAKEIVQHMGQMVSKVNPKTAAEVVTSTGQKVTGGSGPSGTVIKELAKIPDYIKDNRVPLDHETILNSPEFIKTNIVEGKGSKVYKCDGKYYHRDTLHKGQGAHLEVYNSQGKHLGKADPLTGALIPNTAKNNRRLKL